MDFSLQNATTANSATQYVRFNQVFAAGDVAQGQSLSALVGGQSVPLQMDVLTRYADGSVQSAILTMAAPTLAAGATLAGTLVAGGGTAGSAIAANAALAQGYDLAVNMNISGFGATTINAAQQLAAHVASGDFEVLRQGPLATEIRFDVAITRALRLTFDVVTYADGSVSTKVQFQNDAAMGASGGAIVFNSLSIVEGGVTSFSKSNFTQYQYQVWAQDVSQDGSARQTLHVRHDIDYLEQTGAIWNYDLSATVSVAPAVPSTWTNVLGVNGLVQYMPTTGGRPDIGPTTATNAHWLITQDASSATYALAQAQAAGSIPWHYYDTAKGHYLSVTDYPTLWIDPRGSVRPTQIDSGQSGWTTDRAHTPDVSYVAWLLTGDRYHLDMLNAQASWVIANTWNAPRQDAQGLVANGDDEVRAQAWALRTVQEAAYANPDGSYEKAYYTQIANNNWAWLRAQTAPLGAAQGEVHGYFEGAIREPTTTAPWQQDFFASTTALAALQGNEDARAVLKWQANFISGRFLSPDLNPYTGFNYLLDVYGGNGQALTSWAAVKAATLAAGRYETGPSAGNAGYFADIAAMSNANIITVFAGGEDPTDHRVAADAMRAYGWILGAGMPDLRADLQYQIVPRMADGTQIGVTEMRVVAPTALNTTFTFTGVNVFAYDKGVGRATLIGTTGADVLIDASSAGGDRLDGRAGDDYLIGGAGTNVFAPGDGQDYALIRGGAARVEVNAQSPGRIEIEGFRPGTDIIVLTGSTSLAAVLASARSDGYGGTLLTISSERTIRLNGLAPSSLTAGMFDASGANQGGSGTNNAPVAVADTNGSDAVTEAGINPNNTAFAGDPSATGNVLTNDTDVDAGDTRTVTTTGTFTGTYGTLSLAANGTWTYTLNNADADTQALAQGQSVADVFNYTMRDTAGATSSSTLSINITGTNDSTNNNAPVAVADTNGSDAVTEAGINPNNTAFAGDPSATGNVLTNDTDVDAGDTRTVTTTGSFTGTYGTLSLAANGTWTYTLNNADADTQALAQGQSVADVFNYTMRDTAGATSSSTLSINITGTNDAAASTTLNVGAGQTYATLAAAVAASRDGDVIAVQAGTYVNDFATITTKITIIGVGGMANFVATVPPPNGKGILVTQTDVTIQNLSFSGAAVADMNGAGIRYEGGNLVVIDSYFFNNQNGILGNSSPTGTIRITGSEFANNGAGDGFSHNLYVNNLASLVIDDSYFHDADLGHQIKSRAQSTTITNSRIYDGTGTGSYSIDLPNGGVGVIRDNVIQQGQNSDNPAVIHYGGESAAYPGSSLTIDNNVVVNDLTGSPSVRLLSNATTVTATISGADVYGLTASQIASGPASVSGTTFLSTRPTLDTSSPWLGGGTNAAPVAVADTNTGDAVSEAGVNPGNTAFAGDAAATGNVLTNDTDVDAGDSKTVTTTGTFTGTYGTLSLAANGVWTYTLNNADVDTQGLRQGQTATDVFNYTMRDTAGATSSSTLTVTITGTNDAPVAVANTNAGDAVTEAGINPGDASATGNVLTNDTDVDAGDTKTVTTTGTFTGTYGTLSLAANGTWTYTLNDADPDTQALAQGQSVTDVFNYTMRDAAGATSSSTLSIAITGANDNGGPVAVADTNAGDAVTEAGVNPGNTAFAGDASATGNVLTNDTGVTKTVTTTGTFTGTYGALSLAADGTWTYTLNNADADTQALRQGQSVADVFTYTMRDGAGATSSSTLSVTITGTNDAPVAVANTNAGDAVTEAGVNPGNTAFAGDTSAAGNVLTNDTDVDAGDTRTVITSGTFTGTYGTLSLAANGTWAYVLNNPDPDTQALAQGQTVTDVFNYTMRDAAGATSSSTLTVTITGTNDAPVAVADTNAGDAVSEAGVNPGNTAFAGDASATGNVLTNDTDIDTGDTKTVTTTGSFTGTYGTLSLAANGTWTYTLNDADPDTQGLRQGQSVADVFNYTVRDAAGATSASTLSITIAGTNDAPVAMADSVSAQEGIPTTFAASTLLGNDTDVDIGATRTIASVTSGTNGTVSLNGSGNVVFTPTAGFTGTATFTYTVSDGSATSAPIGVTVQIAGRPDTLSGGAGADTLSSGAGNDILRGLGGGDTLFGGADNDRLEGGAGNDTLDGGTGADVMYGGIGADVYIVDNVGDVVIQNQTLYAQNMVTGAVAGWNVDGGKLGAQTALERPGTGWLWAGNADFNGDGRADNLFRNLTTGENLVWYLDARGAQIGSANLAIATIDTSWNIAGVGDFNGDGKSDILWRNDGAGLTSLWTMNGVSAAALTLLSIQVGAPWQVAGVGDFNGDGRADILWRDPTSGLTSVWQMNGATATATTLLSASAPVGWTVGAVGDFTGDGKADIAWRTSGGGTELWQMNGATRMAVTTPASVLPAADWRVVGQATISASPSESDLVQSAVSYTLGNGLDQLLLTGVSSINGTGNAGDNTLTGNDGNNALSGMVGNDTLFGGLGLDVLYGGAGNDILNGGAGVDTLHGAAGNDVYIVDNINDVVVDGAIPPASVLYAQNMVTGAVAGWSIDTGSLGTPTALTRPGIGWLWSGSADFNGDGAADNLFRNVLTGENLVWYLNANGAQTGSANLSIATVDTSWSIAGVGDFNGDGKTDILWRNDGAGLTSLWTMNGVNATATTLLSVQVGEPWQVAGVGDFNGDGRADILWRDPTSGLTGVWQMNGATATATTLLSASAPVGWTVGAVGDFTGDGKADIAWRTSSGGTELWQMNGATRVAVTTPTWVLPGGDWEVVGKGQIATIDHDRVESSVSYTIGDGLERLILTGSVAINGTGNAADNIITGNSAANTLTGGAGTDTLTGGSGGDVFAYAAGHGNDVITDFSAAQGDKIDLTGVTFLSANGGIATLSDGHTITATNGYNWAAGDFI